MIQDRDLFWELAEPEHLKARGFCRKLMNNREDGDDLYQDALVVALTNFHSLRDRTAFRPWFYRIVVNLLRNRTRRSWWKRLSPLTREIEESAGSSNPAPEHAARRTLEIAFKAISSNERAMVTLFEMEGWTIAELARLNGKSEGAVKVRLSRARRKMRDALARRTSASRTTKTVNSNQKEDEICVATKPGVE